MRHGPAEDRAPSGRDFDRALTAPGRDRVRDVARALVDADELPLHVVSSPLVRALQTAEIVAGFAKVPIDVEVRRELAPDGDIVGRVALVRERVASGAKRVMLVGHEPDLTELAARLAGRPFASGFQKAMVVGLATPKERDPEGPLRLRFVLDPKSLEWLEDAR
jgi:phosphohistidine phosphatase